MNFNIARQSLIPAFLLLALFEGVAVALLPVGEVAGNVGVASSVWRFPPDALLAAFQSEFPVWSRVLCWCLLVFAGVSAGRITTRYNLYSVGSCVAVSLFGILTSCFVGDPQWLAAAVLLCCATLFYKNMCRSFCNGYAFDAIFRAGLYLGLAVVLKPHALPLVLLLPVSIIFFRRTFREMLLAVMGLLTPVITLCYSNLLAGGEFSAPVTDFILRLQEGEWLGFREVMTLPMWGTLGVFTLLNLVASILTICDGYALGVKPRWMLFFNIVALPVTAAVLFLPGAGIGALLLYMLPTSVAIPICLLRARNDLSLLIFGILLILAVYNFML